MRSRILFVALLLLLLAILTWRRGGFLISSDYGLDETLVFYGANASGERK